MPKSVPDPERASRIEKRLRAALQPQSLTIIDESHKHQGHHGHDGQAGTHLRIEMIAEAFRGLSRLARQQAVNALLSGELDSGLHALALSLKTPEEALDLPKKDQ